MNQVDLASLLADASQGGAWFVESRDRDTLVEAATLLGMVLLPVELAGIEDKDALLDELATALRFPDWYGANWDALQDCLDDLSWLPGEGYLLLLDHGDALQAAAPEDFATLLEVFDEAARRHAANGTPFWALLPRT